MVERHSVSSAQRPAATAARRLRGPRQLAEQYFDFVWRVLRRMGLTNAQADDAAQDVFLIATEKFQSIHPGRERSFLYGVAIRLAKAKLRMARAGHEEPSDDLDAAQSTALPAPDEAATANELRRALDAILATMPADLREVLIAIDVEGATAPEIAEVVAVPIGTVASRLRRARAHFARRVKQLEAGGKLEGGAS